MADGNELISFIASMSGEGNLRVEENLGEGYVRLRVSEAERRQAKHDIQQVEDIVVEMLRNARDAGARSIYIATGKEEGVRTLLFIDDGSGVPEEMRERIFDARVTSKLESMKMDRWGSPRARHGALLYPAEHLELRGGRIGPQARIRLSRDGRYRCAARTR